MSSLRGSQRVTLCVLLLLGCGDSHDAPDTFRADANSDVADGAPRDVAEEADTLVLDAYDAMDAFIEPGPVRCGFETCADGQECCFATGACFDSDTGACNDEDPSTCASNADCALGEYCRAASCLGPGTCESPPEGCGRTVVCGCDGRDYQSVCQAARFGVRVSHIGTLAACGESAPPIEAMPCTSDADCPDCGRCDPDTSSCLYGTPLVACSGDAHCPVGMSCCDRSGTCVRDDCEGCCVPLPDDTFAPCDREEDCLGFDYTAFCFRSACSGPGGCAFPPSSCGGEVAPVCGCDGVTYTNTCWARQERLATEHAGACE